MYYTHKIFYITKKNVFEFDTLNIDYMLNENDNRNVIFNGMEINDKDLITPADESLFLDLLADIKSVDMSVNTANFSLPSISNSSAFHPTTISIPALTSPISTSNSTSTSANSSDTSRKYTTTSTSTSTSNSNQVPPTINRRVTRNYSTSSSSSTSNSLSTVTNHPSSTSSKAKPKRSYIKRDMTFWNKKKSPIQTHPVSKHPGKPKPKRRKAPKRTFARRQRKGVTKKDANSGKNKKVSEDIPKIFDFSKEYKQRFESSLEKKHNSNINVPPICQIIDLSSIDSDDDGVAVDVHAILTCIHCNQTRLSCHEVQFGDYIFESVREQIKKKREKRMSFEEIDKQYKIAYNWLLNASILTSTQKRVHDMDRLPPVCMLRNSYKLAVELSYNDHKPETWEI